MKRTPEEELEWVSKFFQYASGHDKTPIYALIYAIISSQLKNPRHIEHFPKSWSSSGSQEPLDPNQIFKPNFARFIDGWCRQVGYNMTRKLTAIDIFYRIERLFENTSDLASTRLTRVYVECGRPELGPHVKRLRTVNGKLFNYLKTDSAKENQDRYERAFSNVRDWIYASKKVETFGDLRSLLHTQKKTASGFRKVGYALDDWKPDSAEQRHYLKTTIQKHWKPQDRILVGSVNPENPLLGDTVVHVNNHAGNSLSREGFYPQIRVLVFGPLQAQFFYPYKFEHLESCYPNLTHLFFSAPQKLSLTIRERIDTPSYRIGFTKGLSLDQQFELEDFFGKEIETSQTFKAFTQEAFHESKDPSTS